MHEHETYMIQVISYTNLINRPAAAKENIWALTYFGYIPRNFHVEFPWGISPNFQLGKFLGNSQCHLYPQAQI